MNKILSIYRKTSAALFILFLCVLSSPFVHAADLDNIYGPLVPRGKGLYQAQFYSFSLSEEGNHGSNSFGDFTADPSLLSLFHSLRFSPYKDIEIEAGYSQYLPQRYTRYTLDGPTAAMDTVQEHKLIHFQDYSLQLRLRKDLIEAFFDVKANRQKSKTEGELLLNNTINSDNINSHFEDFKLGLRYLSREKTSSEEKGYFQITEPMLDGDQINIETNLGYKNGKVTNFSDIVFNNDYYLREYFHQLRPHFIPEVLLRYGISDRLELATGFAYATPYKYKHEQNRYNPADTNFFLGTYNIKNDITAPFRISYRPRDDVSVEVSSDFHYMRQRLDLWEKKTNNTIADYTVRKLRGFNTKPTLKLEYFHDAGKLVSEDEFSSLTKPMLKQKQWLLGFKYQKDITGLFKADNNGAQNMINPYGLFAYPLDLFVSGEQESVFFLGNKTTLGAEVKPQNYYALETKMIYGLTDYLNAGMEVGYRSKNSLHHFTIHDIISRYYQFAPYYYFNFLADWKIKENSMISVNAHYVPQYKTFLDTTSHPKQFEANVQYYNISLVWKVLF